MNYRKLCAASGLKEEMVEYLHQMFPEAGDDDMSFDVEGAIYWFAADYHEGKSSELYSILSTSEYRPSPLEYSPSSDNANNRDRFMIKEMYNALVEKFGSGQDDSTEYRSFDRDRS